MKPFLFFTTALMASALFLSGYVIVLLPIVLYSGSVFTIEVEAGLTITFLM